MSWITKTTRTYAWDAGARSIATLPGNGAFTFTVGQSIGIVCGLNDNNLTVDYREINYAFWIEGNKYRIIESGEYKTALADFAPSAVFRIERFEGDIQYFINDVWVFTSAVASTGTLFLDASLIAYNDSIIDATCIEDYRHFGGLLLPGPPLITGADDSGHLLLKRMITSGAMEGDDQFGAVLLKKFEVRGSSDEVSEGILLGSVFTSGSDVDVNEGHVLLGRLFINGGTDDLSYGHILLHSPPFITTNDLELPDIAAGEVKLRPFFTNGNSESAQANLLLGKVFARGTDTDDCGGVLLGLPFTYGTTQVFGSFAALWGQFDLSITFVQHLAIPESLHTSTYGTTAALLHRVSYEGTNRVFVLQESAYGLTAQALLTSTWSSTQRLHTQTVHEAIYGTFGLSHTLATHSVLWSSASRAPSLSVHQASWESSGLSTQLTLHDALWSSRILTSTETLHTSEWASSGGATQQLAVHEVLWSSRILTPSFTLHESTFASIGTANVFAAHTSEWQSVGGLSQVFGLHESLWSSRILTSTHTLHSSTWASIGRDFIISLNDVSWSSVGSLSTQFTVHTSEWSTAGGSTQQIALHDALWSSRILTPSQSLHESTWTSSGLQVTMASHQSDWSSVGANVPSLNLHQASWASSGTSSFVFSTHDTSWSVRPTLLQAHEQRWKSIIETSMLHHSAYETVDNAFALQIHRLIWRSNQTAPIINTGLIYARI